MDFIDKVREVKKNILKCHQSHAYCEEFKYHIAELYIENDAIGTEIITKAEHCEILDYLNGRWRVDISTGKNNATIKVTPKQAAIVRTKTLELIARELGEIATGPHIVNFLKDCGVDKRLIIYPQTKWAIYARIFGELTFSRKKDDRELLLKIITESIHPLNLNGNLNWSEELRQKFDFWLSYDNLSIWNENKQGNYIISEDLSPEEEAEANEEFYRLKDDEWQKKLLQLKSPENLELISYLRKTFQTFINVVETFCQNPCRNASELDALNNYYQFLTKNIYDAIKELGLENFKFSINSFRLPFRNLFSAESDYKARKEPLTWDYIRPKLNYTYGEIDKLYQEVQGSDILTEAGYQKKLSDIETYLSEEKKQIQQKENSKSDTKTTRIEIVKMPKINIKQPKPKISHPKVNKNQLVFFPDDGTICYKDELSNTSSGKKEFSLLSILNKNKNTSFNANEIVKHCNALVNKNTHFFKKEKDIDDTIRSIKNKLKVQKGAYFPIEKRGSGKSANWIWVEK